jgi:large subunit ribosomal protein L9
MAIQVILTEDVEKLGDAGDVVRVKNGFARNFLIPQGKAMLATEGRVKQIEHQRRVIDERVRREVKSLQQTAAEMAKAELIFLRQAGEEGKLFGSVTSADLFERLRELGFEVDRRKIALPDPIKELGEHTVEVRLHREVNVNLRVTVKAAE